MAETARGPRWAVLLVSAAGLGFTPRMPGTVGAALGFFLYLPAFFLPEGLAFLVPLGLAALCIALCAVAIPPVLAATGRRDPQFIVMDEVAGVLAGLCLTPPIFARALVVFLLFRALDILKPFPVDRFERLPGWWGVVADDLAAGLLAGLLAALVWTFL